MAGESVLLSRDRKEQQYFGGAGVGEGGVTRCCSKPHFRQIQSFKWLVSRDFKFLLISLERYDVRNRVGPNLFSILMPFMSFSSLKITLRWLSSFRDTDPRSGGIHHTLFQKIFV
jgi:hypothetical protein